MVMFLTAGAARAQDKTYSAQRFDVDITVEDGSALLVTETVVFDFTGGPFTFVFRELPLDLTDGITVLEATVDGVVYPVGDNPGQVEIDTSNPMRITWHLEPTSNATRTVGLTYRADGVVRKESGLDVLYWQPLPDEYEYAIDTSATVVSYPESAIPVAEPAVLTGSAEIRQAPNQTAFTARNLAPNSTLVFMLQFEDGSLIAAPPAWQIAQQEEAAREAELNAQFPYWITAAVALFGAGFAGVLLFWRKHSAPSTKSDATIMEPPSKTPPAIAGNLAGGSVSPQWQHAQGTLFSLAERGVLIIEELPEQKWYRKHDFAIKLVDESPEFKPHEAGLLAMLFEDKHGRTNAIKLSDMGKKISGSAWKRYTEPLQAEMKASGYISAARRRQRTRLMVFGGLLLAVGTVALIGMAFSAEWVGFGPIAIAAALFLLGITGLIFGNGLSILTDETVEQATQWAQYRRYLKDVSKGKRAIDSAAMFEKHLPYAAAFGLLHAWARRFEKENWTEMPVYFHVLATTTSSDAMALFVVMAAATSSSGGSAAGAGGAGAGAAGGGASGAG